MTEFLSVAEMVLQVLRVAGQHVDEFGQVAQVKFERPAAAPNDALVNERADLAMDRERALCTLRVHAVPVIRVLLRQQARLLELVLKDISQVVVGVPAVGRTRVHDKVGRAARAALGYAQMWVPESIGRERTRRGEHW